MLHKITPFGAGALAIIALALLSGCDRKGSAEGAKGPLNAQAQHYSKWPWDQVQGCAKRIGIAEVDHPVVVGCSAPENSPLFRLDSAKTFEPVAGAAKIVAPHAAGNGAIYALTAENALYIVRVGIDPLRDGDATCIQEFATGRTPDDTHLVDWAISCPASADKTDVAILRRTSALGAPAPSPAFTRFTASANAPAGGSGAASADAAQPVGAVRIAAGLTDSVAWLIDSRGAIFRQSYCHGPKPDELAVAGQCAASDGWTHMPGCGRAIANGGGNTVWVIGCRTDASGNGEIYQWNGCGWDRRIGAGKEIAVDPTGRPWLVLANGSIWRWKDPVPEKGASLPSDPAPLARCG